MSEIELQKYESLFQRGNSLMNEGRYEEAIEAYNNALRIKPKDVELLKRIGKACVKIGVDREAIEIYKQVTHLKPDDAEAHFALGDIYSRRGKDEQAMESFKQVIHFNPNSAETYVRLGDIFCRYGLRQVGKKIFEQTIGIRLITPDYGSGYEQAIEAYNKALAIKPNLASAYSGLGWVFKVLEEYEKAIETFNQAISLDPDNVFAYYEIGRIYMKDARYKKAVEILEQAIQIDPEDIETLCALGYSYKQLGRYEEAIEVYDKAYDLVRDEFTIFYSLDLDDDEAEEMADRLNSMGGGIGVALAKIYYRLGRYEETIDTYETKTFAAACNYEDTCYRLGVAYSGIGDKKSALKEYEALKGVNRQRAKKLLKLIEKKFGKTD